MQSINRQTSMGQVLEEFPGARRALFAKYHIGGCSSCAYRDDEQLEAVCVQNKINVEEVIAYILSSNEADQAMLIEPLELKQKLDSEEDVLLVDTRTREEYEAVRISGSVFMTQECQQSILASEDKEKCIVLYDHQGSSVLDSCSWLIGHGMKNTLGLKGGIDAWSQQVDPKVARYRLEMDV